MADSEYVHPDAERGEPEYGEPRDAAQRSGSADSRLDVAMAERGIARSRTHAARLIAEGLVTVNGSEAVRASTRVADSVEICVGDSDHYVSRAAHKLISALDSFGVAVEGRIAMDVGASTGGFSQVLLERGARLVIALDVGHGQLAAGLDDDARLLSYEGVNARYLSPDSLAERVGARIRPSLVVADLSFISLTQVIPALVATAEPDADFVLLVKPQFEVGRTGIREGVVHNAALRADAVTSVLWAAHDAGLKTAGVISSPLRGTGGNHEYLVWLGSHVGVNPTEWLEQISAMVGA